MTHHKVAVLGAVIFTGFFVSSYIGVAASLVCFAVTGMTALAAGIFTGRKNAALVFTGLAAAFLFYGIYSAIHIDPVKELYGKTCEVTASVRSVSAPENDTALITAEGTADGVPVRFSFYSPDTGIETGDTISGLVKFSEPLITANYNGDYNYSRGIFVRSAAKYTNIVSKGSGFSIAGSLSDYSAYLRGLVREELSGEEGGLMLAMCFGDKSRLDSGISDAVTRSGFAHMTAVSGMHISLIVTAVIALLDALGLKRRRIVKFAAAVVLSVVFMLFFGFSASVCRSAIMLVIYYGSLVFSRRSSPLDSLGAAVLLILLAEPCACRDAGLMLSACGTFGAGFCAPKLSGYLRGRYRLPKAADFVLVCLCASYCTLPVSALIFGKISLVSVFSSVAVYPMFFCVMILALLTAFSGGLLAPFLLLPAGLLLKAMIAVMRFFAGFRYSCVSLDGDWLVPFFAVSAVFIAVSLFISAKLHKRVQVTAAAAVICLCALTGTVTAQKVSDTGITKMTVFSDGKDFLVSVANDAGISAYSSEIDRRLSAAAYRALSSRGAQRFDLLCVLAGQKHGSVYSRPFDSLNAIEKHFPDSGELVYDVGGRYTAEVYEDAVIMEINGLKIVLADIASVSLHTDADIAIYKGYKKSAGYANTGTAVLCDKRYSDVTDAYNAYYSETEILISPDGRYCIKTK